MISQLQSMGEIDSFCINEIEKNLRSQSNDFDGKTELYYNIFKYYDKQIARFIIERRDWFIRKEVSLLINLILLLKLICVDYY